MKSLLVIGALVFAASSATASATKVNALTQRAAKAASKAKTGKASSKKSDIMKKLSPGAALSDLKDETLTQAERVVEQLEEVAKSNDVVNGLSKNERVDVLEMIYVNLMNNNGKNKELDSLLTGQLAARAAAPASDEMGSAQYGKFVKFLQLAVNGTDAEDASRQATGGSLKEFADNCGTVSAASRR